MTTRRQPPEVPGVEPDPRASLAAERTYLAYLRTGLALVAAGVAVAGALPGAGALPLRRVLGIVLIAAGGAVFVNARRRWRAVREAMRQQQPLPPPRFAETLTWVLVGVAVVAVAVVVTV